MEGAQNAMEKRSKAQESYRRGEFQQSIEYANQWLSIVKNVGDQKKEETAAYNVLAWSYYMVGDYKQSIEYAKKAVSSAKDAGNKERESEAYNVLAWSYYKVEDYKRSIEYAKEAVSVAREAGSKERESEADNVLAASYHGLGEHHQGNKCSIIQSNLPKKNFRTSVVFRELRKAGAAATGVFLYGSSSNIMSI